MFLLKDSVDSPQTSILFRQTLRSASKPSPFMGGPYVLKLPIFHTKLRSSGHKVFSWLHGVFFFFVWGIFSQHTNWNTPIWTFNQQANKHILTSFCYSGQILTFHQPRFPWNSREFPLLNHHLEFLVVFLVAIIWPESGCVVPFFESTYLFPGNPSEAGPPWSGFV